MKVWVTRDWLAAGVRVVEAERSRSYPLAVEVHREGSLEPERIFAPHWHDSEAAARGQILKGLQREKRRLRDTKKRLAEVAVLIRKGLLPMAKPKPGSKGR